MPSRMVNNQLTVAHRRALALLAGSTEGMTEGLTLALGFKRELIAELIDAGLVAASKEYMGRGSRPVEIVRLKITEAGRRVLDDR